MYFRHTFQVAKIAKDAKAMFNHNYIFLKWENGWVGKQQMKNSLN
jgi:hypothetical protein